MSTTSGKLPGIKLLGDWSEGEDGWADGVNSNWLALSVLTQASALDIVDEVPFTPAEADIYILSATASLNANQIAVYHKSQWTYIAPSVGFRFFVQSKQAPYNYTATGWIEETTDGATEEDISKAVSAEAKLRTDADNALSQQIGQEVTRAQDAEKTISTSVQSLSTSLGDETDARKTADNSLAKSITDEINRAQQAEEGLQSSLADEVTRSKNEDSRLDVIAQLSVIDIVDSLPANPTAGDIYILSSSASANANQIAIYTAQWTYITPSVGFIAYVQQKTDYYKFVTSWVLAFNSGDGVYIKSQPATDQQKVTDLVLNPDSRALLNGTQILANLSDLPMGDPGLKIQVFRTTITFQNNAVVTIPFPTAFKPGTTPKVMFPSTQELGGGLWYSVLGTCIGDGADGLSITNTQFQVFKIGWGGGTQFVGNTGTVVMDIFAAGYYS